MKEKFVLTSQFSLFFFFAVLSPFVSYARIVSGENVLREFLPLKKKKKNFLHTHKLLPYNFEGNGLLTYKNLPPKIYIYIYKRIFLFFILTRGNSNHH